MRTEIELLEAYAQAYKTRDADTLRAYLDDFVSYITPVTEFPLTMSNAAFLQMLQERFDAQTKVIPIECVEIKIMTVEPSAKNIISVVFGAEQIFVSVKANHGKIGRITVSRKAGADLKVRTVILQWPQKLLYEYSGRILITKENDPHKVIDLIISSNYPYEDCVVSEYDPNLIVRLIREGFFFMSGLDSPLGLCMAMAAHHLSQSVLFFDCLHVTRTVKRLLGRYELRFGVEFDRIVDKCVRQHGGGWITPSLIKTVREIRAADRENPVFTSFGLYRDGELVAGEFGTVTGRIYSSYSGYYDVDNAGSIQMVLTARYLMEKGFAFWDLGMPLPYKKLLGAKTLNLEAFTRLWRAHSVQAARAGMAWTPSPEPKQGLSDLELLTVLKDAYRYYYVDDLREYIADDFYYTSLYNPEKIKGKEAYLYYMETRLKFLQNRWPLFRRHTTRIVYDRRGGAPYLLVIQNRKGVLIIPTIKKGMFKKMYVCDPEDYELSGRPLQA